MTCAQDALHTDSHLSHERLPEVLTIVYAAIYKATTGATALPTIPSLESAQPPLAARASVSVGWENLHVASILKISILYKTSFTHSKVKTAAKGFYQIG